MQKRTSISLSTQPQINTFIYPTIKTSLFAIPKTKKFRGSRSTSKSSEKPYISSIFTLSIMYFSQQNHALNMHRLRKLIHSPHSPDLISAVTQHRQVPGQCSRITAHINHTLRLHLQNGRKTGFPAALPGRIHNDHIRMTHVFC